MNDYKELIGDIGDCLIAHPSETLCKRILREAADAIEQLVSDYEILAKMYAKVNEDLCVRTKERDAAVSDLKENRVCTVCVFGNDDALLPCDDCYSYTDSYNCFEWRGVQEDNDEID